MNKSLNLIIFTSFYLTCVRISSQNLVINSSFEKFTQCLNISSSPPTINYCQSWFNPNTLTADYWHECAPISSGYNVPYTSVGYQMAQDSGGMAGIYMFQKPYPDTREYITGQLKNPLIAGEKYYVSFYANMANIFGYCLKTAGAYFSNAAPSVPNDSYWAVTPQVENTSGIISDTVNWYMVADSFTAIGGEQFITIGNFRPDSLSDTINLYPSGIQGAYYFIDAVTVIPYSEVGIGEIENIRKDILVYLDPESNIINIVQKNPIQNSILEIFSMDGRKMEQLPVIKGLDSQSFHLEHLDTGLYFYSLRSENSILKTGKIILVSRN